MTPILLFASYILVVICLAIRDSRRGSDESFLIAERRVGPFATMASISGNLRDGAGLLAWVTLGAAFGFGALWLTFGLCAGLIVVALLASKARLIAAEGGFISIAELIDTKVGQRTALVSETVIACTALLYSAAQLSITGEILSRIFNIGESYAVGIVAITVCVYLLLGGFRTTVTTGVFQWFILLLIVFLPWLVDIGDSNFPALSTISSPGVNLSLVFASISFFVVASSADIWQLVISARDEKSARNGVFATIPVYILLSIGLILFANMIAATNGNISPEDSFYQLFVSDQAPAWAVGIIGVFCAAAIMSTLDSQLYLFVSTVGQRFLKGNVKSYRLLLLVTVAILSLGALSVGDIIVFLFGAVTLGTILFPVILVTLTKNPKNRRLSDTTTAITIILTAVVYAAMFVQGAFANFAMTLVPVSISSLLVGLAWAGSRTTDNSAAP